MHECNQVLDSLLKASRPLRRSLKKESLSFCDSWRARAARADRSHHFV